MLYILNMVMHILIMITSINGMNVEVKHRDSGPPKEIQKWTTRTPISTTTTEYLPAPYCGWPDGTKKMVIFGGASPTTWGTLRSKSLEIDHPCTTGGNQIIAGPFKQLRLSNDNVVVDSLMVPYKDWVIAVELECSNQSFCQQWNLTVMKIASRDVDNPSVAWELVYENSFNGYRGLRGLTGLGPHYLNESLLILNSLPTKSHPCPCSTQGDPFGINLESNSGSFINVTGQRFMRPGSVVVHLANKWYLFGGSVRSSAETNVAKCDINRNIYEIYANGTISILGKIPPGFQPQTATGVNGQLFYCGFANVSYNEVMRTNDYVFPPAMSTCYRWDLLKSVGNIKLPNFYRPKFATSLQLFNDGVLAVGGRDQNGTDLNTIEWLGKGSMTMGWFDVKPMTVARASSFVLLVDSE